MRKRQPFAFLPLTTILVVSRAAAQSDAPNTSPQKPSLRDVRDAVVDTLRETPKSAFPAGGIPLRVSAPAAAGVTTWHFRAGIPLGLGAFYPMG